MDNIPFLDEKDMHLIKQFHPHRLWCTGLYYLYIELPNSKCPPLSESMQCKAATKFVHTSQTTYYMLSLVITTQTRPAFALGMNAYANYHREHLYMNPENLS